MANYQPKPKKDSFFSLHFTSTVSIALVLLMLGLITLLIMAANQFTDQTKENISVSVILKDDITEEDLSRLNRYLNAAEYTKEVKYISKEDALAEYTAALGEDPVEFLGYNPLHSSLEVYLKAEYADTDSITKIVQPKISSFPGILEISYQKDMLQMFNQNVNRVTVVLGLITIVLLLISIVLINNTIRLSIYSKRFIINTMKLVGAKAGFIRRPFIRRSLFNGIIAALLAILMLAGTAYYLQSELGADFDIYRPAIILPVVAVVFLFSLLITYLATFFSVNRYIRMKTDQLYFI